MAEFEFDEIEIDICEFVDTRRFIDSLAHEEIRGKIERIKVLSAQYNHLLRCGSCMEGAAYTIENYSLGNDLFPQDIVFRRMTYFDLNSK